MPDGEQRDSICSSSLAPRTCLHKGRRAHLRLASLLPQKKIFKVTVAVSDRSLLAFGGGGKALCG